MYAEKVTYTDYNGNERTDTLYFNLTKSEMMRLDLEMDGNLREYLIRISESRNGKEIMEMFDKVLRLAYGVKSDDGKRFMKGDDIYKAFTETEAYNEFFFKLVTDASYAGKFIDGVVAEGLKNVTINNTTSQLHVVENSAETKVENN